MKFQLKYIVFILMVIACKQNNKHHSIGEAQSNDNLVIDSKIDSILTKIVEKNPIVGMATSIVSENSTIYQQAFGSADLDSNLEYTANTIQPLASISKTFIGLSVMILVDQGKLSLDDNINNILPYKIHNPFHPEQEITVRDLVTHTSTITDNYDDLDESIYWLLEDVNLDDYNSSPDVKDRLEYFKRGNPIEFDEYITNICLGDGKWYSYENFLDAKPGYKYEYSNLGATIAARIVEIKSGQSFIEFTNQNIFKPLGMKNTSWEYGHQNSKRFSNLFELDSLNNPIRIPKYHEVGYSEGQLKSHAEDMSLYLQEMLKGLSGKGSILSNHGFRTLFTPQLNETHFEERSDFEFDDEYNTGVFWAISPTGLVLHNGAMDGVYSFLYLNPINKIGVIAFSNTPDNSFGQIRAELRKLEKQMPAGNK